MSEPPQWSRWPGASHTAVCKGKREDSRGASAIACAVAIQRALAEHRQTHGFSTQVCIGVHASEATSQGTGYRGKGVHRAARIGALADGGEILVSQETLAATATPFDTSAPRTVTLKGMSDPATVVAIVWQ